ncbi:Protoheme IX farnesyltransferase, mitochondrial [Lignoscripta atroalba]|nr:Protoheme IX farnesyltransferase, mitochondrial [Lignoscripta atroalba]
MSPSNARRRFLSTSPSLNDPAIAQPNKRGLFRQEYFSANSSFDGTRIQFYETALAFARTGRVADKAAQQAPTIGQPLLPEGPLAPGPQPDSISSVLPLRLHGQDKEGAVASVIDAEPIIPPDASSRLSTLSTTLPPTSLRRLFTTYLSLSKPRLSFLIVLTTAASYSLYPVPAVLLPSTTISPSLSTLTLLFLTTGTALCCASANALNMLLEPQHDAKMSRTRNRPLVRGLIGKKGALIFSGIAGILGVGGLYFGVNPTVAFLGGLNIILYAGVYTPMKRIHVLNTWAGAIVGGIPPLMGWAAAAGQSATDHGNWEELLLGVDNVGGWLLAGLLFAWQFPHFNALSWTIREEYKNAGYRMLAWTNPRMNGRVALRYSLLFFPICIGLTWYGVTDQGFLITSSVVNAWIVREAYSFWKKEGQKGSARGLFWASVWHLPVVMVLAMAHKKGLWEGIWRRVVGEEDDDGMWMQEDDQSEDLVIERKVPHPVMPFNSAVT